MSLTAFAPRLGFTRDGNYIESIEAKNVLCKVLDVDGDVDIDGDLIVTGTITNPSGGSSLSNPVSLVRTNDTVADTFQFVTGATVDWQIKTDLGARTLSIVQGAGATNQNLNVNLGTGALNVTGSASFTGSVGAANTGGFVYIGAVTASVAGTSTALNSKAGTVTFTGQTIASNAAQDFTITNTAAGNSGLVSLTNVTGALWANGSDPKIENVTWNLNTSVVVRVRNYSGATSTGASSFAISFISFK